MALSVFEEKDKQPTEEDLESALGNTYHAWKVLCDFVSEKYPKATTEWKYSGIKYGWGMRLRDKKRAIIYLTPSSGIFQFGLVLGEKATNDCRSAALSPFVLSEIESSRVYAEGRGIRLAVTSESLLADLKKLILIKLKY
jgi:hypothetical protein